jgi:hypothetical protein
MSCAWSRHACWCLAIVSRDQFRERASCMRLTFRPLFSYCRLIYVYLFNFSVFLSSSTFLFRCHGNWKSMFLNFDPLLKSTASGTCWLGTSRRELVVCPRHHGSLKLKHWKIFKNIYRFQLILKIRIKILQFVVKNLNLQKYYRKLKCNKLRCINSKLLKNGMSGFTSTTIFGKKRLISDWNVSSVIPPTPILIHLSLGLYAPSDVAYSSSPFQDPASL